MLQISGYEVITAVNGLDALKMLRHVVPDVILMDLAMPELDGVETTLRIKQQSDLAHIPVIAVTGHVTAENLNRALAAGCADYLSKPVDYDTLIAKIKQHIDGDPSRILA